MWLLIANIIFWCCCCCWESWCNKGKNEKRKREMGWDEQHCNWMRECAAAIPRERESDGEWKEIWNWCVHRTRKCIVKRKAENKHFFIFAQRHNNLLHTLIYHRYTKQWQHRKADLGARIYTLAFFFVNICCETNVNKNINNS